MTSLNEALAEVSVDDQLEGVSAVMEALRLHCSVKDDDLPRVDLRESLVVVSGVVSILLNAIPAEFRANEAEEFIKGVRQGMATLPANTSVRPEGGRA